MLSVFLCFSDILGDLYFPYFLKIMLECLIEEDLLYISFIMYLVFLVCHSLSLVLVGSWDMFTYIKLLAHITNEVI